MRRMPSVSASVIGFQAMFLASMITLPGIAAANGEFFQIDRVPGATSATGTIRRDRLSFSLGWSEFETGHAASAWVSYGFPLVQGVTFRAGPALRVDNHGQRDIGLRAGIERFSMNERMTLLLLAEFNTIQSEYLAVGQVGHRATGISAELALQGNDAGFRERSVALSYRLAESPVRLRLGYRYTSRRVFVGLSINTF